MTKEFFLYDFYRESMRFHFCVVWGSFGDFLGINNQMFVIEKLTYYNFVNCWSDLVIDFGLKAQENL